MDYSLTNDKKKTSFWGKLFGTSKKQSKKNEDSFRRQSFLHSSFHCSQQVSQTEQSPGDEANFTTLDSSSDMHMDAGIIFLNKNHVHNCLLSKDDDKRVQFVPTPMNKYYHVDTKAAPSNKVKKGEDKENIDRKKSKPTRPILRLGKNQEKIAKKLAFSENQPNAEQDERRLVNVTSFDGPQIKKTPTIPRTSTKIALLDRKNESLPHLNLSGIMRYGSLPRTAKLHKEIYYSGDGTRSENNHCIGGNTCGQVIDDFSRNQEQSKRIVNRPEWYSSQLLPRYAEQKPNFRQLREHSKNVASHRLSLGEPVKNFMPQTEVRYSMGAAGLQHSDLRENWQMQENSKYDPANGRILSNGDQISNRGVKMRQLEMHSLTTQQTEFGRSNAIAKTNGFPNKAINEIGLPITNKNIDNRYFGKKQRSRSESPHYIPLAETYSSNIPPKSHISLGTKNSQPLPGFRTGSSLAQNSIPNYPYQFGIPKKVFRTKSYEVMQKCPVVSYDKINQKQNQLGNTHSSEDNHFISQSKKQAIMTKMYSQKRMLANKLCKYKSKECDEGFSSMADDECSFNCSCSSCLAKFSKVNGKVINDNRKPLTDDRFFFICTENYESKEERILETVPESPVSMNKIKNQCNAKSVDKNDTNNTWYECNDSLCKTPREETTIKLETNQHQNEFGNNKDIENIYENITQIINSATKKNFKPQEIQKMFSTPLSKPECLKGTEKSKRISRALFPEEDRKVTPPQQREKCLLSPLKSPLYFSDSVLLLQEIFQKLSQECKELLQPNISSVSSTNSGKETPSRKSINPSAKYVNDLVKSLRAKEISEGEFARIIGTIAQNIFLEAKSRRKTTPLIKSSSLPDIKKKYQMSPVPIQTAYSLVEINSIPQKFHLASDTKSIEKTAISKESDLTESNSSQDGTSNIDNTNLTERDLPDGWSRTPSTLSKQHSTSDSSPNTDTSKTDKDDSRTSESDLLLENAIRIGMGLSPINKVQKTPMYSSSPVKSAKYKSKDVLSCKGKLRLKIYHNTGHVTANVIRAAKLSKSNTKDLNSYIKISMVPDETKRVNWRTLVQKAQKNPVFNQKFSFEVTKDDISKRLVFSVWHRDFIKQRSELIGCMSFSIKHILDDSHKIDGWYRLLREGFGTEKHFAAHTGKNACPLKSKSKKAKKLI